ncbi:TerD family protein [Neobacillus massiliamazoniensis]|uniref:Tellurium resistance protein terD,TerD family n=1 Tax=Neobacillus massiliamazoniensis TaxID=1499688 RepID=A0A0U1NSW9_9BACI|nr:TerD family protein [Neobacillus massiliamazoniensis]CRK81055.1 Tellurium resistance protein terD,TerD family [Neobacillus massiliamazoniensis]
MGVTLRKGQKVDLTKSYPGLQNVVVGLGWSISQMGSNFDLDASAFLLGQSGKVNNDLDFVFYNNPNGGNGSIIYSGDNRVGSGVRDDEQIRIDLKMVPDHIHRIAFTITIHDAQVKRQNFGQISDSYVRIFNEQTNEELLRFNLGRDFTIETAIVAAELYRHNGEWKFNAIASGFQGGLAALCGNFGVTVDDVPATGQAGSTYQPNQPTFQQNTYHSNQQYQNSYNSYPQSNSYQPTYQQAETFTQQPSYGYPTQTYPATPGGSRTYGGEDITCPRCYSSNIRTGKKGFGLGKAAIGGLILGPVGLLGGFIGQNQLKFTCNSCGNSWAPSQTDYAEWANNQKRRAQDLFQRYKSQDVLDAVVAACALVSMADGYLDASERQKMLEFVNQSEELRVFDPQKVIQKFNFFISRIERDPMAGRAEAFRALGKMRTKPDMARLIARYCIAIGYADGNFDNSEKQAVADVCRELGLNPAEFLS